MGLHDMKITGGRLVLPDRVTPADLLIDEGRITAIVGPGRSSSHPADQVIDASGLLVLPGLVDVHVHLRDPGAPHKEDFASGSAAAAAGGVTTIADMPNTSPPTTTPARFEEKKRRGEEKSRVDFALHGAPHPRKTSGQPEEEQEGQVDLEAASGLARAGALSFKIYLPHGEEPHIRPLAGMGLPLTVHAEDPALLSTPAGGSAEAFLASRPVQAEIQALQRLLMEPPPCPLHICHLTTRTGLSLIQEAKRRGVTVTCEVTPHHLLLTSRDLERLGPPAKTYPPLRPASDAQALVEACLAGQVDLIASDHAPHADWEKAGPEANFATAPAGIPGVETALPLLHTQLVCKAGMPLTQLIQLMALKPARIFGLRNTHNIHKGQIAVGADADLTLFDPKATYTIRGADLHGKPTLTPFEGRQVTGRVRLTLLRGQPIHQEEETIDTPTIHGRFLPRRP